MNVTDSDDYVALMIAAGSLALGAITIVASAVSDKMGAAETTGGYAVATTGLSGAAGLAQGGGKKKEEKDIPDPEPTVPTPETIPPTFSSPVETVSIEPPGGVGDTGYAHMGFQVPSVAGDTGCLKATLYGMEVNFIP